MLIFEETAAFGSAVDGQSEGLYSEAGVNFTVTPTGTNGDPAIIGAGTPNGGVDTLTINNNTTDPPNRLNSGESLDFLLNFDDSTLDAAFENISFGSFDEDDSVVITFTGTTAPTTPITINRTNTSSSDLGRVWTPSSPILFTDGGSFSVSGGPDVGIRTIAFSVPEVSAVLPLGALCLFGGLYRKRMSPFFRKTE